MNFGQQSSALLSTVSIINSLDDATREKVLAELPDELKRRLIAEQHAANILAAAGLNLHPNVAQQLLASGFLNLSTPEITVGHTINFLKTPGGGIDHAVLKTSPVGASHNVGIKTPLASNIHGAPFAHHMTSRLIGTGINDAGFKPTAMDHAEARAGMGSHHLGMRISGASPSQSMNSRLPGSGIAANLSARASTSQNFNLRANVNNTGSMNSARLGVPSVANVQMSHSYTNAVHFANSTRFSSLQGSSPSAVNGNPQPLRHKPITSIYLDDFKQGFPSKGLSVFSNRWWGSAEPDKTLDGMLNTESTSVKDIQTSSPVLAPSSAEDVAPQFNSIHVKVKGPKEVVRFCTKVTRSRNRAAVCGRRALKLGLTKGYGVQKLGEKDADLLRFVFGGSLPREWLPALPASA